MAYQPNQQPQMQGQQQFHELRQAPNASPASLYNAEPSPGTQFAHSPAYTVAQTPESALDPETELMLASVNIDGLGNYVQQFPDVPATDSMAYNQQQLQMNNYQMNYATQMPQNTYYNPPMTGGYGGVYEQGDFLSSDFSGLSETLSQLTKSIEKLKIDVVDQPQKTGYRYRYEVEGKQHGGLQADGSAKSNKKFPSIKITGRDIGDYKSLYLQIRIVQTTDDVKPHPNKLMYERACTESGIVGMTIDPAKHPDWKVILQSLQIIQVKKEDREISLKNQLKFLYRGTRSDEVIAKEAKQEAKTKFPPGVTRLRFDVFVSDRSVESLACAFSNVIHDAKTPATAELKIVRQSRCSAPVTGGAEVYLLCEKITKDDIEIHFKKDRWMRKAQFHHTDVHHQYAIVYRVPEYKHQNIAHPVTVDVYLYRPTTKSESPSVKFTYEPVRFDEHAISAKKRRITQGPSDMRPYNPYPGTGYPGAPGGGGGSSSGMFPGFSGSGAGGSEYRHQAAESDDHDPQPVDLSDKNTGYTLPSTIESVENDSGLTVSRDRTLLSIADSGIVSGIDSGIASGFNPKHEKVIIKPEPGSAITDSKLTGRTPRPSVEIEIDDEVEMDCAAVQLPSHAIIDTQPGFLKGQQITQLPVKSQHIQSQVEMDTTVKAEPQQKYDELTESLERRIFGFEDDITQCLQLFAIHGDPSYFLSKFRLFMSMQDEYGDNTIQLAVIHGQYDALRQMLKICVSTNQLSIINQVNDQQQTAIITATIMGRRDMVSLLLEHGADPLIRDTKGENCFHIATRRKQEDILLMLCKWFKNTRQEAQLLDTHNFDGLSALHLSVFHDVWPCADLLINAGCDLNNGDASSGRTSLHHAVEQNKKIFVTHLLYDRKLDVNCQSFDGRTALHLAVSAQYEDIVKLLMMTQEADPALVDCYPLSDNEEEIEEVLGHSVFDLAKKNQKILEILRNPIENKQNTEQLTDTTLGKLSKRLDKDNDWKKLAEALSLEPFISYCEEKAIKTPSTEIIQHYLVKFNGTLAGLHNALIQIARPDCAEIVKRDLQEKSEPTPPPSARYVPKGSSLASGREDSGFKSGMSSTSLKRG